jgi:hypothetical protein
MAFDTVDALSPEQRQAALKAKVAAGFPALNTLKANVSASDAVYIDRVTIAFAAALVHHTLASNKHPCLQLITNKHLPKLLVAVAKGHCSSKRNGTLLLKPYQHGSSVIEEFVQARIRTDRGRRNWNVGGLQLTRADLPTLINMSAKATAAMGYCCTTPQALAAAGLLEQPFDTGELFLQYYCAHDPLFNEYYFQGIHLVYGNSTRPPLPRAGSSVNISSAIYQDPRLAVHLTANLSHVREICTRTPTPRSPQSLRLRSDMTDASEYDFQSEHCMPLIRLSVMASDMNQCHHFCRLEATTN